MNTNIQHVMMVMMMKPAPAPTGSNQFPTGVWDTSLTIDFSKVWNFGA